MDKPDSSYNIRGASENRSRLTTLLQGALAAGIMSTAAAAEEASAETHKGVMTVVGASFGGTTGHSINVDFNAADPAASTFTAETVILKQNTQAAAAAMNYDHIIGDRFIMTHEPKGTSANAAGLHLYWNLGGKKAVASNLQFNGSNVEDFSPNDEFLFSEGDTPDQDQVIAKGYDETTDKETIKAYKLLRDESGKPIGLKLSGKTILATTDIGEDMRVYKNILSATSTQSLSAWVFEQKADGTYVQKTKKDLSQEQVSIWSDQDRKPIFPTPNGINIALASNQGVVRANADLSSFKEVKGGNIERSFGENNKYRARQDDNANLVIENSKGDSITLASDVKVMIGGGITQISKNPETFVLFGYDQYIIITINSESPLKVTASTFANDLISKNYNKKNNYIIDAGKDTDNDHIYTPYDNAPNVPNASQTDSDKDGLGDAQDASPGIAGFSQNEVLPDSGFRFLCNPGKINVGAIPGGGENISFANMAIGDTSNIQLIGQEKSNNSKLTITVPAGYEINANIIDGGIKANGVALTGTMITSASTVLTLDAFSNIALTFKNMGVVAPADVGSTEKDAGSTGTDATTPDMTEQDAGKADTNNTDTGTADAGSSPDTDKDAGSTGTDATTPAPDTGTPNGTDADNTQKIDAGNPNQADTTGPTITNSKPPEGGCDANGKPIDSRTSGALAATAAALILAIRKRARENGATAEEVDKIQ